MRPSGSTTGSMSFDRLKVIRRSDEPSLRQVHRLVLGPLPASFRSPGLRPTKATCTQGSTLVGVIV